MQKQMLVKALKSAKTDFIYFVFTGDQLIAKRRNEKFKRIKCSTLAKLLRENINDDESIYQLNKIGNGPYAGGDSISQVAGQHNQHQHLHEEHKGDAESIISHRTGVSQASAVTYATEMIGITANTTFLLLDLRDAEDYALWRIKEAINFPAPNIGRDKVIPELYRFKNMPDKLIIVYMGDERQGTQYAQMLTEKGYENTYLLSGGIEGFLEEFSDLCEGKSVPIPQSRLKGKQTHLQSLICFYLC